MTTEQKTKELLNQIDILSNCIQGVDDKTQKDDIAYLIHTLIDKKEVSEHDYKLIAFYKIQSHKHFFVEVN